MRRISVPRGINDAPCRRSRRRPPGQGAIDAHRARHRHELRDDELLHGRLQGALDVIDVPHRSRRTVQGGEHERGEELAGIELAGARPREGQQARDGDRVVDELGRRLREPRERAQHPMAQQDVDQRDPRHGAEQLRDHRRSPAGRSGEHHGHGRGRRGHDADRQPPEDHALSEDPAARDERQQQPEGEGHRSQTGSCALLAIDGRRPHGSDATLWRRANATANPARGLERAGASRSAHEPRGLQHPAAHVVQPHARRVAVVDDGRRPEDARHAAPQDLVHRRVQVPVQHEQVPEGLEHAHHAHGADQPVEPLQGLRGADEGGVVLHDQQRPVGQAGVAGAEGDAVEGVVLEPPRRAGDGLVTGHVERQDVERAALDDLARLLGAGLAVGRQRPLERGLPRVGRGVQVVVAGDEGDALGRDARVVQGLGERLELAGGADLGQVARDDVVAGADPARGREGVDELALATDRVERAAEAEKPVSDRIR